MKCKNCSIQTSNPSFCSLSCSTSYANKNKPKRKKVEKLCKLCDKIVDKRSTVCKEHRKIYRIEEWLNGEWSGGSNTRLSTSVRNFLLQEADYTCKCGFNTPHPTDGASILEVNHIDGDGSNHRRENLEILCPNCHALTDTYRGRNLGNGRSVYYTRKEK